MSIELAKIFMTESRMCDRSMYAEGYVSRFPDGSELPADAICSIVRAIVAAGPDFSFNVEGWQEKDGVVSGQARVSATMTNEFSHPQFGTIPATHKKAALGVERFSLTFRNGKVARMDVSSDVPGGPPELIRQWTA